MSSFAKGAFRFPLVCRGLPLARVRRFLGRASSPSGLKSRAAWATRPRSRRRLRRCGLPWTVRLAMGARCRGATMRTSSWLRTTATKVLRRCSSVMSSTRSRSSTACWRSRQMGPGSRCSRRTGVSQSRSASWSSGPGTAFGGRVRTRSGSGRGGPSPRWSTSTVRSRSRGRRRRPRGPARQLGRARLFRIKLFERAPPLPLARRCLWRAEALKPRVVRCRLWRAAAASGAPKRR